MVVLELLVGDPDIAQRSGQRGADVAEIGCANSNVDGLASDVVVLEGVKSTNCSPKDESVRSKPSSR